MPNQNTVRYQCLAQIHTAGDSERSILVVLIYLEQSLRLSVEDTNCNGDLNTELLELHVRSSSDKSSFGIGNGTKLLPSDHNPRDVRI